MADEALKKELQDLYEETKALKFQKKTYESDMEMLMTRHKGLMERIAASIDLGEEQLKDLADVLPAYVEKKLDAQPSRRKRQMESLDHNMNMVSYILPFLGEVRSLFAKDFTKEIVTCWNRRMPQFPIGHSTYEDIRGGFKKGIFCFITSAVCRSMGKPDDCYELDQFRHFRDTYLSSFPDGRKLIRQYYDLAPTIVSRIEQEADSDRIYTQLWKDYLSTCLRLIENGQYASCQTTYCRMVTYLADRYVYDYGQEKGALEGYA